MTIESQIISWPRTALWCIAVPSLLVNLAACSGGSGGNSTTQTVAQTPPPISVTYTVGGSVSGLAGAGLVLQNNSGDNLTVSTNGAFTFVTQFAYGSRYSVTILTQPVGTNCRVVNSTDTITANVINVVITCVNSSAPALTLGFGIKQLQFAWTGVSGAMLYRLMEDSDGASGYSQVGADLPADATATTLDIAVFKHNWANARYLLEACNSSGCTASNEVNTIGSVLSAIGYVKASNTSTSDKFGDFFGTSVALSGDGDTLAVGAWGEDSSSTGINSTPDESAINAGAVYIYTYTATGWNQQAYVKASNTGAADLFGASVALSGDGNTLAVGARLEDSSTTGVNSTPNELGYMTGAVYVYSRSAGTWAQQAYVKASNTADQDYFGVSVALSGDGNTLAVGATGEASTSTGINSVPNKLAIGANCGAVYIYTRIADTWTQQAYVKATNTGAGDYFGDSVALNDDGNTLAVGATGEASTSTGINSTPNDLVSSVGAVYVYVRTVGTWSQQAYVKSSNTGFADRFGSSVSLSGDGNTLAVGMPGERAASGAVYVFSRTVDMWSQQAYVNASNTGYNDEFGLSVALSSDGKTLAVGAYLEDSRTTGINSMPDESALAAGAAYVFIRRTGAWLQQAYVKASNAGAGDVFGASVALSGDGNTLAVGAWGEDSNSTGISSTPNEMGSQVGAVYLY